MKQEKKKKQTHLNRFLDNGGERGVWTDPVVREAMRDDHADLKKDEIDKARRLALEGANVVWKEWGDEQVQIRKDARARKLQEWNEKCEMIPCAAGKRCKLPPRPPREVKEKTLDYIRAETSQWYEDLSPRFHQYLAKIRKVRKEESSTDQAHHASLKKTPPGVGCGLLYPPLLVYLTQQHPIKIHIGNTYVPLKPGWESPLMGKSLGLLRKILLALFALAVSFSKELL